VVILREKFCQLHKLVS